MPKPCREQPGCSVPRDTRRNENRRFPPGQGRPPSSMIPPRPWRIGALNARSLAEADRAPYPSTAPPSASGSIESTELIQVFVRRLWSVYFFLPRAHRGARVIGTDALRILPISREPSDGQERKQDNKYDPNINAHQS